MSKPPRRFTRTREQTLISRRLKREVSKTEKKLWFHLQSSQMGAPFRHQHRVSKHFADYCCIPLRLVVEVDGPTHSAERDSIRDYRMHRKGFDVLRFTVQELDENFDGVISAIYGEVQLRLAALKATARG